MPRSDGRFPRYEKLDIDPDTRPPGYDNFTYGSRRCVECDKRWPNSDYFNPSPCCSKPTKVFDMSPSMSWREAVKVLNEARFERYYEAWNENVTDEELDIDVRLPVKEEDVQAGMTVIDQIIEESQKDRTQH